MLSVHTPRGSCPPPPPDIPGPHLAISLADFYLEDFILLHVGGQASDALTARTTHAHQKGIATCKQKEGKDARVGVEDEDEENGEGKGGVGVTIISLPPGEVMMRQMRQMCSSTNWKMTRFIGFLLVALKSAR